MVGNRPVRPPNELKTLDNDLHGRNPVDFGTVRPRVHFPGPRPFSYSKSAISGVVQGRRGTAGAQFRWELSVLARAVVTVVGRSELGR
jgi:hypothetical protein